MDFADFWLMVLGILFCIVAFTALVTFLQFRVAVARTKREAERRI